MRVSIWFIITVAIALMFGTYFHEQAHVNIYKQYGIKAETKYFKDFPHISTYPEEHCPNDACMLAHEINEIITYNLFMFFLILSVGLYSIILLLEEKMEN